MYNSRNIICKIDNGIYTFTYCIYKITNCNYNTKVCKYKIINCVLYFSNCIYKIIDCDNEITNSRQYFTNGKITFRRCNNKQKTICHRTGKSTFAIRTTQRKTQDCKRAFPFPTFANAQKKNKFPQLQPKRPTLPNRWHSI